MVLAQALGLDRAAAFVALDQTSASRAAMALPGAKTYLAAQIAALLGRNPQADVLSGRFRIGDLNDLLQIAAVPGGAEGGPEEEYGEDDAITTMTPIAKKNLPLDAVR